MGGDDLVTEIYLAVSGNLAKLGFDADYPWVARPVNLLVSFVYLKDYEKAPWCRPERLMLDSGAYSAWKSGRTVKIEDVIAETKNPRWHESVALDVVGDHEASYNNAIIMKEQGSPAMPVFHYGEPWSLLNEYKCLFPKIGLSCRFGEPMNKSVRWVEQCFARAWPHKFHSFGWVEEEVLSKFPFHSADTANWKFDPNQFGKWKAFGPVKNAAIPGGNTMFRAFSKPLRTLGISNLRAEVDYYLKFQAYLRHLWGRQFREGVFREWASFERTSVP